MGWLAGIGAVVLIAMVLLATTNGASSASGNGSPSQASTSRVPTDPGTELRRVVEADADRVSALEDTWIPQISSKYVGLVADGRTYDEASILADHRRWEARYPGALLLHTGPYASFKVRDAYVTVVPQTFGAADGAKSWCDARSLPSEDCFAKIVSRTRDWGSGTTGHR